MICTHGGDDNDYWRGKMRYDDPDGSCYINAGTELTAWDLDLEFLHLSSCHSMIGIFLVKTILRNACKS